MDDAPLIVTAANANRQFSKLLRAARDGRRVTITSHGRPVAELGPIVHDAGEADRQRQWLADMQAHWATLAPVTVGPWTRDELYDRR